MEIEEIFKDVCKVIEESIGTPADTINLDDTLFDSLEVDSIDLVDILFELEVLYDLELKISDIESRAKVELGDTPYEIEGVLTKDGIDAIARHMTEIDDSKLREGLTVHELVKLFSVHSLCKIIKFKMDASDDLRGT